MLIKEYRTWMPFTVEEFRIAQRFLVAKSSKERTIKGQRVEIVENRPFSDENGSGQYTHKIYHIGNSVPSWTRAIVPASALAIEEKAWNSYPRTRTIMTCPFFGDKLKIEVFTIFCDDRGEQDNIFNLDQATMKKRTVDYIDIAYDDVSHMHIEPNCDPTVFKSVKTGRGPLNRGWEKTFKPVMCSYKLCNVEFNYWGFQSKVEQFIHQLALRDTIHKAHREVVCWIDDWYGLTMEDIDKIEAETALILKELNSKATSSEEGAGPSDVPQANTAEKKEGQTKPSAANTSASEADSRTPVIKIQQTATKDEPSQTKPEQQTNQQPHVSAESSKPSASKPPNDESDDDDDTEFFDALDVIVDTDESNIPPSTPSTSSPPVGGNISELTTSTADNDEDEDDEDEDALHAHDPEASQFAREFSAGLAAVETPSLPANLPLFPAIKPVKWNRRRTRLFTIPQGAPNHRGLDVIHPIGSHSVLRLRARFTYGSFGKKLKKEVVEVYGLFHENPSAVAASSTRAQTVKHNSSLARHTSVFSSLSWEHVRSLVTAQHSHDGEPGTIGLELDRVVLGRLVPGFNLFRGVVPGDMSYVSVGVYLFPQGTNAVVFSINAIWKAMAHTNQDVRTGMLKTVVAWKARGYAIIYVCRHADRQKNAMASWLQQNGFPFGVLRFNFNPKSKSEHFFVEYIRSIQDSAHMKIAAAYAHDKVEVDGLVQVIKDKHTVFTTGDNAGYLGTNPVTDLLAHADSCAGGEEAPNPCPLLPYAGWSLIIGRRL